MSEDLIDNLNLTFATLEAARAEAAARNTVYDQNMTDMDDELYAKLDRLAKAEGWALFIADGVLQIQSVDDPEGGNPYLGGGDGEAYALVARKAAEGSKAHILALYLDGRQPDENEIYVPKFLLDF